MAQKSPKTQTNPSVAKKNLFLLPLSSAKATQDCFWFLTLPCPSYCPLFNFFKLVTMHKKLTFFLFIVLFLTQNIAAAQHGQGPLNVDVQGDEFKANLEVSDLDKLSASQILESADVEDGYGYGGLHPRMRYSYNNMLDRVEIFSHPVLGPPFQKQWHYLYFADDLDTAEIKFTMVDGVTCVKSVGGKTVFKDFLEQKNKLVQHQVKSRGEAEAYAKIWDVYLEKIGALGNMVINGLKGNHKALQGLLAYVASFLMVVFGGYFLLKHGIPMFLEYLRPRPKIIKEKRLSWKLLSRFRRSWPMWRSKKTKSNITELHYDENVTSWLKKELVMDAERVKQNLKQKGTYRFRSVLLHGVPGTGKTVLAKEYASAVDFDFVHVGGASWSQLSVEEGLKSFKQTLRLMAENPRPVLCFIDEIDSIFPKRQTGTSLDNKLTNDFLAEIDKASHPNIKFVFATNFREALDTAILSRIGKEVEIGLPTEKNCQRILFGYIDKYKKQHNVTTIGKKPNIELAGLTGRDIEEGCREMVEVAALLNKAELHSKNVERYFDAKKQLAAAAASPGKQINTIPQMDNQNADDVTLSPKKPTNQVNTTPEIHSQHKASQKQPKDMAGKVLILLMMLLLLFLCLGLWTRRRIRLSNLKGKQAGKKQGIELGRMKGKQELARQMLLKGINKDLIAELTGVALENLTPKT